MARPTLYDVARHAGVSLATASRVVNGSERGVGEALRERVLRSATTLGYVANGPAQALARSATPAVGVIVHDIADPYFTEIALGAMGVADDGGRLATVCNTFGDPERERRYVALLNGQRVAAIVLAGSGHDDPRLDAALASELASYQLGGGRFAMVGRHAIAGDSVVPDNRAGAERLGRALVELGHRRIGVITGPPGRTTTEDRLAGLRAGGVAMEQERIVAGDFGRESGARGAGALLERDPGLTAIVAASDMAAIGALSLLRSRGIAVPEQVSVLGFDDVPVARDVGLSTVRLPLRELGATAMRLALDDRPGAPRTTVLPTELVLRATSGAPYNAEPSEGRARTAPGNPAD